MQNWIIRYVEDLKARIEPTGCSIAAALAIDLPKMERARLLKLLEAADDLRRIVELELQRREDLRAVRPVREGYKRTSEAGGVSWRVYCPEVTDEAIRGAIDCCDGYYAGPGHAFARAACIRRTATRVLVTQYTGLDV